MDTMLTEHIWNTARMPVAARGLGVADCPEIDEELRELGGGFVESFRERYIPPMTPVDSLPKDRSRIGVGLTFSGPAGRGKTSLACAIATEVALAYRATIYFVAAPDYLHAHFDRNNAMAPDAERAGLQTVYHRAQHAALLVLDDMGAEMITNSPAAQREFSRLIRHRHSLAQPTLITTNLGPTGWTEAYGAATGSFLHQAAPITAMTGADLRRGR